MTQEPKVIIIDDDKLLTHNWKILLNFIGEDVVTFGSEQWNENQSKPNEKQKFLAVIIGKLMDSAFNENAFEDMIRSIHQY